MIFKYGPLVKTLRFESKNGYFKQVVQNSKNRINLCQSMAKRHQMLIYSHHQKDNILECDNPKGVNIQEVSIDFFEGNIQKVISSILTLSENSLFIKSKSVYYKGQRYNRREAVVLNFSGDEYVFGLIEHVLFQNSTVYLLVDVLKIEYFDTHYHAYSVSSTENFNLIQIEDLLDYHPLAVYKANKVKLISLRHFIHVPFKWT